MQGKWNACAYVRILIFDIFSGQRGLTTLDWSSLSIKLYCGGLVYIVCAICHLQQVCKSWRQIVDTIMLHAWFLRDTCLIGIQVQSFCFSVGVTWHQRVWFSIVTSESMILNTSRHAWAWLFILSLRLQGVQEQNLPYKIRHCTNLILQRFVEPFLTAESNDNIQGRRSDLILGVISARGHHQQGVQQQDEVTRLVCSLEQLGHRNITLHCTACVECVPVYR